jgi:hypothetical protein
MLPPPGKSEVDLPLAGHKFTFRRLTWREEVEFSQRSGGTGRQAYIANALTTVDGKTVDYESALKMLRTLPRPIYERVVVYYLGSLPGRRIPTSPTPYQAPEAASYQRVVDTEDEEMQTEEERILERTFGKDEVEEQRELAQRMVKGTHAAGVTRSLLEDDQAAPQASRRAHDESGVDREPPRYHMVVT